MENDSGELSGNQFQTEKFDLLARSFLLVRRATQDASHHPVASRFVLFSISLAEAVLGVKRKQVKQCLRRCCYVLLLM